jgi:hypothetical protein
MRYRVPQKSRHDLAAAQNGLATGAELAIAGNSGRELNPRPPGSKLEGTEKLEILSFVNR